jgi:PhnB protein
MKISPYISFNGNCAEAIVFYEKVFDVKADVMQYKDAPSESGFREMVSEDEGNFVMHAQLEIGNGLIMLHDRPSTYPAKAGENIAITVEFDDIDTSKVAFDALKEGGAVIMELHETIWSKSFGVVIDKFGMIWNIEFGYLGKEFFQINKTITP